MRPVFFALCVCLLLTPSASSDALSFAEGFVLGLEKDPNAPDACASDSSTLFQDTENVISNVLQLMDGDTSVLTTLILAAQKLSRDLQSFNGDCNFTSLIANIESIFTPEGISKTIWTYLNNESTINTDWQTVQKCSQDFAACGQAAGQVFSLVTDWSI